jgi:hypothetical protein
VDGWVYTSARWVPYREKARIPATALRIMTGAAAWVMAPLLSDLMGPLLPTAPRGPALEDVEELADADEVAVTSKVVPVTATEPAEEEELELELEVELELELESLRQLVSEPP